MTHSYAAQTVLGDVNLSVERGTMVAVVGPSGSGKSTLLAIAGLLLAPSEGNVEIDGVQARQGDLAHLRRIGWVFQTTNALGRRTAVENVAQPLLAVGWTAKCAQHRARGIMAELGIEELANQRAADCSGGELQRVCIARALVGDPAVIVADEPTGQLDADTSALVLETLRRARDTGTAVLLATHDKAMSDSVDVRHELVNGALS